MAGPLSYVSIFFLTCIFLSYEVSSHGHSHGDHDHHGHNHEDDHHGHAHDHHGHAHDHHGHAHDHGHSHGLEDEPPQYRYSRQANEPQPPSPKEASKVADSVKKDEKPTGKSVPKLHGHAETKKDVKQDSGPMLWLWAVGSTLVVSSAPVLILLFIPLDNRNEHQSLLKVLLSFASGGLLGDAFLHLIPHAIEARAGSGGGHTHSHSHGGAHSAEDHTHDLGVGLWVLSGIVAFLAVEKFVRCVKGGHGHSHEESPLAKRDKKSDVADKESEKKVHKRKSSDVATPDVPESNKDAPCAAAHAKGDIKIAAYLNLAADFTHNFTDGLAIGAGYIAGHHVGIITTIAILLHEVPHEIGDFAILIQSGYTKKKAMLLQLTTAAGALFGTVISLIAGRAGDMATPWILPFTAGGFIYIATVSVIPELLTDSKLWQSIKEIAALGAGIFMMVIIAKFE